MTLYVDIRGALQSRLAAVTGVPAIAYEGMPYTPVIGTPFINAQIVQSNGRPATMGDDHLLLHSGSFELGVTYPSGAGTLAAETMADTIKADFRANDVLTQGSTKVRLRYAERYMADITPDWVRIPISIGWYLFATDY